jgi:hypothetical protein
MPFTFCHPAIVLPLRRFGSLTAFVIGSMIPDFEGFISLSPEKEFSHTLMGAFLFDLPVAWLCCFLFHLIVKEPLINNLPAYFQKRFNCRIYNWNDYARKNILLIFFSLLLGIFSHLLWDHLTHPGIFNILDAPVVLRGEEIKIYIFVQYACSLVGALIIAWYVHYLPVNNAIKLTHIDTRFWMLVLAVMLVLVLIRFTNHQHTKEDVDILINTLMAGLLGGILLSSIVFREKRKSGVYAGSRVDLQDAETSSGRH